MKTPEKPKLDVLELSKQPGGYHAETGNGLVKARALEKTGQIYEGRHKNMNGFLVFYFGPAPRYVAPFPFVDGTEVDLYDTFDEIPEQLVGYLNRELMAALTAARLVVATLTKEVKRTQDDCAHPAGSVIWMDRQQEGLVPLLFDAVGRLHCLRCGKIWKCVVPEEAP